jgi:hypothetical protein
MVNSKFKILLFEILIITILGFSRANNPINWKLHEAANNLTGTLVSLKEFNDKEWYPATVPGTVLKTLIDNKVYDIKNNDPFYGKQMWTPGLNGGKIPDIGASKSQFWYRGTFNVDLTDDQRAWIHFDGINYKAVIHVNGQLIGTISGAFKRAKFDITDNVTNGENYCAVMIIPNNYPGTYSMLGNKKLSDCTKNGRTSDNADLGRDGPTFFVSQSWDWMPVIGDRNIGIWNDAFVKITGPVVIRDPFLKTELDLPDTTEANITLKINLVNATGQNSNGIVEAVIKHNDKLVASKKVEFTNSRFDTLVTLIFTIKNPKLWWPNGYGNPELYSCNIEFKNGGIIYDSMKFRFGIRDFGIRTSGNSLTNTFSRTKANGGLTFKVNGVNILVRGGNWGIDDAMKITDNYKLRMKVRYHKEMNFNMIRNWCGQTDDEVFYDACDENGILVWDDFWMAHNADQPIIDDNELWLDNAKDKILRNRNHPCIALWCARNESEPISYLNSRLYKLIIANDGTRDYQAYSADAANGSKSGGPYDWCPPESYYSNSKVFEGLFHTEIGSQAFPTYESLALTVDTSLTWPNQDWGFHDWCILLHNPNTYIDGLNNRYGLKINTLSENSPQDLQTACKNAQLLNIETFKAIYESLNLHMFKKSSGILLWMSNPAWPNFTWQTYDYFMDPTGAYWGCKSACEPVHIQYATIGGIKKIAVINTTKSTLANYKIEYSLYNIDGPKVSEKIVGIPAVAPNSFYIGDSLSVSGMTPTYFLFLKLINADGGVISRNMYWLSTDNVMPEFSAIATMNKTVIKTSEINWRKRGSVHILSCNIHNEGSVVAFANRVKLIKELSGKRILPAIYSDNYFSLMPGESQSISIEFDDATLANEKPVVTVEGFNTATVNVLLPQNPEIISVHKQNRILKKKQLIIFRNKSITINNIPNKSLWNIAIFNLSGRLVYSTSGTTRNNSVIIPITRLGAGAYIIKLIINEEQMQSMFVVKK